MIFGDFFSGGGVKYTIKEGRQEQIIKSGRIEKNVLVGSGELCKKKVERF